MGNFQVPNGRLEIWNYDYTTATTFGDGSATAYDYDDTVFTGATYGSVQVHDMTNKKTLLAWNRHANGLVQDIGIGNNDSSNIHYLSFARPDWTNAVNGAYGWKFQVLVNTDTEFVGSITSDAATALVGAYSLQLLSNIYKGPTVQVRRGSDNVTADFYADISANLTLTTGQSLINWLAGAIGYISIWYDQSGKGNHAVQKITSAQPAIDILNRYLLFANSQFFNLPDGTVPYGNSKYTVIAKHDTIGNTTGTFLASGPNFSANNSTNTFRRNTNGYVNYWWGNDITTASGYLRGNVVTFEYDQVNRYCYINNALQLTQASSGRSSSPLFNFIGCANNDFFQGNLHYLYIFNTDLSDADRLKAEASLWLDPPVVGVLDNISGPARSALNAGYSVKRLSGTYYGPTISVRRSTDSVTQDFYADTLGNLGMYLNARGQSITSWLNGATGFITTWYDQSGNGKHATQTVTSAQPSINIINTYVTFDTDDFFRLPDGTVPNGNTKYTVVVKHDTIGNVNGTYLASGANFSANNSTNTFRRNTNGYVNYWWNNDATVSSGYAVGNVVTFKYDQTNRYCYINTSLLLTQGSSGRASSPLYNNIGCANNGASDFLQGSLYYINIFNTDLSNADRLIMEAL